MKLIIAGLLLTAALAAEAHAQALTLEWKDDAPSPTDVGYRILRDEVEIARVKPGVLKYVDSSPGPAGTQRRYAVIAYGTTGDVASSNAVAVIVKQVVPNTPTEMKVETLR